MIVSTIKMKMPLEKLDEALKILKSTARHSRIRSGCLGIHIYSDSQEDDVLMVEEMWKSAEELEHHLRSGEYLNVLMIMEMAVKHPEVRFNTISASSGIETIEKARSSAC
jgi:quinol monooxygenase YgiN